MKIAVIGLGSMGDPIARNLIEAGHVVSVYNRTAKRADPFRALRAKVAATAAEAVADVDAAITMVSDDVAVEDVVFGGLLESLPRGAVHIAGIRTP